MSRTQRSAVALLASFLLIAGTVLAQPMRMTPEQRTDSLAVQLNLTKEQKPKVLDVFKSTDAARRKAFEDSQGDRDAMRAAMQSAREDGDKKLKEILTKEQYEKYQKLQDAMRARRGNMMRERSNGQ